MTEKLAVVYQHNIGTKEKQTASIIAALESRSYTVRYFDETEKEAASQCIAEHRPTVVVAESRGSLNILQAASIADIPTVVLCSERPGRILQDFNHERQKAGKRTVVCYEFLRNRYIRSTTTLKEFSIDRLMGIIETEIGKTTDQSHGSAPAAGMPSPRDDDEQVCR